eukprot:TRINITY_DN32512_c0_g1_i1.p1 TRINITY_DN32512_c0_g1~~TRINITY_DN32512_c0_g1_i1.p1  ORF type:complete len:446 (+),score=103.04 TRINITY_DN32512_c0_g1_i1:70-1407(+)
MSTDDAARERSRSPRPTGRGAQSAASGAGAPKRKGKGKGRGQAPPKTADAPAAELHQPHGLPAGPWPSRQSSSSDEEEEDGARMASDKESGFKFCENAKQARAKLEDGQTRLIEFGNLSEEDRDESVNFVCSLLTGSSAASSSSSAPAAADTPAAMPLKGFSFAGCRLTAAHLKKLAAALKSTVSTRPESVPAAPTAEGEEEPEGVHAIGISKNPDIPSEVWHELFEALPFEATWFDFGDNGHTDDCVRPLIASLPGRYRLEKLYLDGNKLQDIENLSKVLPDCSISELDLGDNKIGEEGAKALADVLPRCVVMVLVLGSNPISADGAKAIAEVLPRTSLDILYLNETGADDGFLAEMERVLGESKLAELHLDHTKITERGVRALIPKLEMTELCELDITGNGVSRAASKLAEKAMQAGSARRQAAEEAEAAQNNTAEAQEDAAP